MRLLNFAFFTILVGLLGLAQSLVLPASESNNGIPSRIVSLAHPGYSHTQTDAKARGAPWNLNCSHRYMSSSSNNKNWQPEHTGADYALIRRRGEFSHATLYPGGLASPKCTNSLNSSAATSVISLRRTGYTISAYHPQLTGSADPRACKDGVCLEGRSDDYHVTQTAGWANIEHARTFECTQASARTLTPQHSHLLKHTRHTIRAEAAQTDLWTYSEHTRPAGSTGYAGLPHDTGDGTARLGTIPPQSGDRESAQFNTRDANGTVSIVPCPAGVATTCPSGQRCALIEGFDMYLPLCLPQKNTATLEVRAEVTAAPDPVNCTQHIIFLEPHGNHDVNITYLGCDAPLRPHFSPNSSCVCTLPSNSLTGSPKTPGPTQTSLLATATGLSPRTVPLGSLADDGPRTVCDLSCDRPSKPYYYRNGTCFCASWVDAGSFSTEVTRFPGFSLPKRTQSMSHETPVTGCNPFYASHLDITGNCRVEEGIDLPDQPWNEGDLDRNHTWYVCMNGSLPFVLKNGTCCCVKSHTMLPTGYPGSGEVTMTTFSTVQLTGQGPSVETAATIASTAERSSLPSASAASYSIVSVAAQSSLTNRGRWSDIAAIVASTSAYVGSFPFDSNVPVEPTVTIGGSLEWSPELSLTNTKGGQTYLQARAAVTASATCPPGLQIVNPEHPLPSGSDSLAIAQAPTSRRLEFSSLPFSTASAAHPEPKLVGETVDIEILVGETADQGPRYVTLSSAGGLGVFCEFLKTGSYDEVHGCLPQGADREQVEAEYCKGVLYLDRESAPTETAAPRYKAINSASPTPSNDMDPGYTEILTDEESGGKQ